MTDRTYDTAAEYFDDAEVGDVIRVPVYENALEVTFKSPDDGAGMLGVEFVDDDLARRGSSKHIIQNIHSGRLYLVAGSTDKGEVETVEVLA